LGLNIHSNLERKLGLFSVTNIVIANMIGAGIFTTSGLLMTDLDDPVLLLVLWIVGGFLALAGALCYGELGAAMPKAGGEYTFLANLFHPLLGFLSGWVSFVVGFSAPIAASSIGFSEYLYRATPFLFEWGGIGVEGLKKIFAILIILIFTWVHLRGIEFGARIQNYLTVLKVGLLAGLILLGFTIGNGEIGHITLGQSYAFNFQGWKIIGLSLLWIMFSYSGWNASTYIGSEIQNPTRNLPASLITGTVTVMVLYLFLNLLFVYALTPDEMKGVISIGGLTVSALFNQTTDTIFSLLICFALFSSISAFIILGPRVYFAMAKDGHFFRFAGTLDPKYRVPTYSIVFQAIISSVIILSGTLDQILTYMGFSLGIFPIIAVFGVIKLRMSGKSVLKLPGYPVTAIVFIACGLIMLTLAFFERPMESSIAIITLAAGLPAYWLFKRHYRDKIPTDN
jgi:APA family basic amino acid/polyamine antiporter